MMIDKQQNRAIYRSTCRHFLVFALLCPTGALHRLYACNQQFTHIRKQKESNKMNANTPVYPSIFSLSFNPSKIDGKWSQSNLHERVTPKKNLCSETKAGFLLKYAANFNRILETLIKTVQINMCTKAEEMFFYWDSAILCIHPCIPGKDALVPSCLQFLILPTASLQPICPSPR